VFIAIVTHYVMKSGQLGMLFAYLIHANSQCENVIEALLINFHQLEGEHSGANMAEATWDTLTRFGIENQVGHKMPRHQAVLDMFLLQIMAFMTDNASNNNTLIDGI
jgi:hypothetical protein